MAKTPSALDKEPPRFEKLARMANIVASMFSGHIFDISTTLGIYAIMPTIGSRIVSPTK